MFYISVRIQMHLGSSIHVFCPKILVGIASENTVNVIALCGVRSLQGWIVTVNCTITTLVFDCIWRVVLCILPDPYAVCTHWLCGTLLCSKFCCSQCARAVGRFN